MFTDAVPLGERRNLNGVTSTLSSSAVPLPRASATPAQLPAQTEVPFMVGYGQGYGLVLAPQDETLRFNVILKNFKHLTLVPENEKFKTSTYITYKMGQKGDRLYEHVWLIIDLSN